MLSKGLAQTATLKGANCRCLLSGNTQAAIILDNEAELDPAGVQHRFSQLLTIISQGKSQVGELADAIEHTLESNQQLLEWIISLL